MVRVSKQVVFVRSVVSGPTGVVVEASNGSNEGPPFVRFTLPTAETSGCHIGKRYSVTIERDE